MKMTITLNDYNDANKTLTFNFKGKTDHGFLCTVNNKIFEFDMLFSYIEALGMLNYFRRLNTFRNDLELEDLNLDRHGILLKNAFFEKGDVTFDLEINIDSPEGKLRFTSNNLHSKSTTKKLEEVIQGE